MSRKSAPSEYVHGTAPEEQNRLSQLNEFLNRRCLDELALEPGQRILDVGSGLGQLTCAMAQSVGPEGYVLGIERSAEQRARAEQYRQGRADSLSVELRDGDVLSLPLDESEIGTFDVAHARFVLEHLRDPAGAVRQMIRAVRPEGRLVLADDDHDLLRFDPPLPRVLHLWRAYIRLYERLGNDPYIGRRLVRLLHDAGAVPLRNTVLFFGSCAGNPTFDFIVENFAGVILGSREPLLDEELATEEAIDAGLEDLQQWRRRPDAAIWYSLAWAEGQRPAER